MLAALTLLCCQSSRPEFIPARDHGQRTVEEWTAELRNSRGGSLDAIWSLYFADARSEDSIQRLREALRATDSEEARRAIDTILCQWHAAVDPLSVRAYSGWRGCSYADDLFRPPHRLADTHPKPPPDLVRTLESAIDALVENHDADAALDEIIRLDKARRSTSISAVQGEVAIARTHDWAAAFAGSAYAEALGRVDRSEIERTGLDNGKNPPPPPSDLDSSKPWVPAADNESFVHQSGLLDPVGREPNRKGEVSISIPRSVASDVDALDPKIANNAQPSASSMSDRVRVRLLEMVKEDGKSGRDALQILGHLGIDDPVIRARYLVAVRNWSDYSETALEHFPCRRVHDEETLTALDGAIERAPDRLAFQYALSFAGLTNAERSPLAMRFLSDPRVRSHGDALVAEGFRGLFPIERDLGGRGLVNQLALRIATLKDKGESFAAEETALVSLIREKGGTDVREEDVDYRELGFSHARALGLGTPGIADAALDALRQIWMDGTDDAEAYLDSVPLAINLELELRSLRPWEAPKDRGWRDIESLVPYSRRRLTGPLGIELVPSIRLAIYGGQVQALDELSMITSLLPRDEDYLLATLERGPAEGRAWAVDLVRHRNLDTARIRSALHRRIQDLDAGVRRSAGVLIAERGW